VDQQRELIQSQKRMIELLSEVVRLMHLEKRAMVLSSKSIEETLIRKFGQELVDRWKEESFGGKPEVGVLLG
jgi:hypothetical protein